MPTNGECEAKILCGNGTDLASGQASKAFDVCQSTSSDSFSYRALYRRHCKSAGNTLESNACHLAVLKDVKSYAREKSSALQGYLKEDKQSEVAAKLVATEKVFEKFSSSYGELVYSANTDGTIRNVASVTAQTYHILRWLSDLMWEFRQVFNQHLGEAALVGVWHAEKDPGQVLTVIRSGDRLKVTRQEEKNGKTKVLWQGEGSVEDVFLKVTAGDKVVFEEWVYQINDYDYFGALGGIQEVPKLYILGGAGTPIETFYLSAHSSDKSISFE